MSDPEEDPPGQSAPKSTFKSADSDQFQIGTRISPATLTIRSQDDSKSKPTKLFLRFSRTWKRVRLSPFGVYVVNSPSCETDMLPAKRRDVREDRRRDIDTLFMLEWMQDPELRKRVQVGLNKGEARNALAGGSLLQPPRRTSRPNFRKPAVSGKRAKLGGARDHMRAALSFSPTPANGATRPCKNRTAGGDRRPCYR